MMKKRKNRLRTCLIGLISLFAISEGMAQFPVIVRTFGTPRRAQRDTGDNIIQAEFNNSGGGMTSVRYKGGDIRNNTFQTNYRLTGGQAYMKVGKHEVVGSRGFPKRASSVIGRRTLRYNCRILPGFRMRGTFQLGGYVWLESSPRGDATHEINIWHRSFSLTRPSSYRNLGTTNRDGATYRVYRRGNNGFESWYFIRQSPTLNVNVNYASMTRFLRTKGMPNHFVYHAVSATEGHNRGAHGVLNHTNFTVSSL